LPAAWYASDALWSALEYRFDSPDAWRRAGPEAQAILDLIGLPSGADIADLASGTGRIAFELARRGHTVTAVERHPAFANRIAKRARNSGTRVEIVRRDMATFERNSAFDLLLLWNDSFGYFESVADDRGFLARCARSIRPDGKLLIQLTPKELAPDHWPRRTWTPLPGDRLLLEENLLVRSYSMVRHTWIAIDGKARQSWTGLRRLYSASELVAALYEAGFSEVECYGTLTGAPFDRDATTLIAVATR